jgi:hypothetical protein
MPGGDSELRFSGGHSSAVSPFSPSGFSKTLPQSPLLVHLSYSTHWDAKSKLGQEPSPVAPQALSLSWDTHKTPGPGNDVSDGTEPSEEKRRHEFITSVCE